ncbi:hypothetical protein AB0I77_53110 [Streptomyces sp. NPDC050619]|uniref:hypothetical protein n=1 Tax=Streptomyces sp. NPDC050619 TaxID=3157214 RepID=UPI00341483CC
MASALVAPIRFRRASDPDGEGGADGAPPPPGEFTQRAAVLVQVPGQEEAVAREQWERRGLLCSRISDAPQENGAALFRVEVRLLGSRWGALSEAERRVMAALTGRVTARLGDATLLRPDEVPTAASTWHVYRKVEWGDRWWQTRAAKLWEHIGAADVHRRVRLDGPGTQEEALAALHLQSDLGDGPFGEDYGVRPGIASAHALRPQAPAPWYTRVLGLPVLAAWAAVMLFGWALAGLDAWWQVVSAPLLLAAAWWTGPWIADGERHHRAIVWLCGLALVGGAGLCGYTARVLSTVVPDVNFLGPMGLVLGGLLILPGCIYALRQSWFSRNAATLLPVVVLPFVWVVPWMGRLAQGLYLGVSLGVPLSAANTDSLGTYLAGVQPALWCIGAALCGLAALGWARHFYWITGSKAYCIAAVGTLTALMMLVALVGGLASASTAAKRTAAQAAAGHDLAPFFGITARRVCVIPLDATKTAVQPGPLPTDHPVVAIGATGDETWLWDPQRARGSDDLADKALRVRTDQITTLPAAQGVRTCPAA